MRYSDGHLRLWMRLRTLFVVVMAALTAWGVLHAQRPGVTGSQWPAQEHPFPALSADVVTNYLDMPGFLRIINSHLIEREIPFN